MPKLYVSDHPLVQDKLAALRDKNTQPEDFRRLMGEVGNLIGCEVLKGVRTRKTTVQTPLKTAPAVVLDQPLTFVAVLRAGLGLIPGLLELAPKAAIGHIGLYRDEKTLEPVTYYQKLPPDIASTEVLLIDPMLATGGSGSAACESIGLAPGTSAISSANALCSASTCVSVYPISPSTSA